MKIVFQFNISDYLSIYLSIYLIFLSIYLSIYQSINLSMYQAIYLIYLIYLSVKVIKGTERGEYWRLLVPGRYRIKECSQSLILIMSF